MKIEFNFSGVLIFVLLILQGAFLFCKLAGITNIALWSLSTVLIPLWICLGLLALEILLVALIALALGIFKKFK